MDMKEAMFYERLDGGDVKCSLCAHRCRIKPGRRGICAVRENQDGALMSLVYGRLVSMNIDPIEKKPLFHFMPGTASLSIATVGCNLRCQHCQNASISQYPREHPKNPIPGEPTTPDEVVGAAIDSKCDSISYTYTEPTIFLEFAYDTALKAKEKGIENVFVSNGFMTPESAAKIAPLLGGNNIDLKGDEEFYKTICGAHVEPVKETIKIMKGHGVWVEVTTLIIPGLNDSVKILSDIAAFIASVDIDMPWHVTQFYPTYKLIDRPRTPVDTLRRARDIGIAEGLRYVYEGNVPGEGGENTYCHSCKELLIKRYGFSIIENKMKDRSCPKCGAMQAGRWG